ncbi:hypothetical protein EON65_15110 [archaeon]|nr:MAG: hypothetical protein EON65_15110 [archaeon]
MTTLSGGEGTGKSALADSVAHQIFIASKHNPLFRIYTFRNRPSSLEMHIPFHGVKPILQDLLAKVASLPSQSKTPRTGSRPGQPNLVKESSLRKVKLSLKDTIFSGLSIVFTSLPAELRELRCLLSMASIIPPEEGVEMKAGEGMDEEKRLQATIDLIVAMMGLFPVITKASVLLVM